MTSGDRGPRMDRAESGRCRDRRGHPVRSQHGTPLPRSGRARRRHARLAWARSRDAAAPSKERRDLRGIRQKPADPWRKRSASLAVADAEPLWTAIVGADPARPAAFVQRLIRGNGRLAWFYDAVQHLDANRQNLVLGRDGSEASRVERLRELLNVFESVAPEWLIPERPFVRPLLDPGLVISLVSMAGDSETRGPSHEAAVGNGLSRRGRRCRGHRRGDRS